MEEVESILGRGIWERKGEKRGIQSRKNQKLKRRENQSITCRELQ